jgi:hypothetical protein
MKFGQCRCPLDRHPDGTLPPTGPGYGQVKGSGAGKHRPHLFECNNEVIGSNELLCECDMR